MAPKFAGSAVLDNTIATLLKYKKFIPRSSKKIDELKGKIL